jgi:TDG/mug DNA glycosylase family protein
VRCTRACGICLAETLPDLLGPGLRVVFVGINPSTYSVARGHYFARKTSRFWPAFSRSALSAAVRAGLGKEVLGPEDDVELPRFGFGFTDVVKVPSSNAAALEPADFREWAPRLLARLRPASPRVLCFHGTMAYRPFRRWALGLADEKVALGEQPERVGDARIFVIPNPSPANAHVRPEEQAAWYDRLAAFLGTLD